MDSIGDMAPWARLALEAALAARKPKPKTLKNAAAKSQKK